MVQDVAHSRRFPWPWCLAASLLAAPALAADTGDDWIYTVERGDTLIGISGRLLQPPQGWRALQRLNKVKDPRRLQPGRDLRIPLAWLRAETRAAEVADVVGKITLTRSDGQQLTVVERTPLQVGDSLSTAADSSAVIHLADGSRIRLVPGSRVMLRQSAVLRGVGAGVTRLELQQGGAESQVQKKAPKPRFEIQTPVLDLGARGTDFRARFDSATQRAWGEVTEGRIAAALPGAAQGPTVLLEPGFGIVGQNGALGPRTALLAAPDLSAAAARVERLPVRLAWAGSAEATGWRAQVAEPGTTGRLLLDGRFGQPQALFGDLPDGDYVLRVRAIDANGLEGADAERPFRLKARPEPPFLREPQPGQRRIGATSRFVWALSSAARSYRLQVAADEGFTQPLHDRAGLLEAELELPVPPGRWFWRLASVRADDDTGPFSDPQAFEQAALPPSPAAPQPEPPSIEADRIVLRWAAGQPGDRFEFQLAREASFAQPVLEQRSDRPEATLEALEAGRYHVRSRVVNSDGVAGAWGAPSEFEVPESRSRWWWLTPVLLLVLWL